MEYLIILISVFIVCLTIKWRFKLRLFDSQKQAFLVFGCLFAVGVVWDTFSIYRGYWTFDNRFLVGLTVGLMPIEEYLFIIVIPLLTLTIYGATKKRK
jgi:lycopene cyclase domain-containing protein